MTGPHIGKAETACAAVCLALVPALAGTARGLLVPGLRLSELLIIGLGLWSFLRFGSRLTVSAPVAFAVFGYAAVYLVATLVSLVRRPELEDEVAVFETIGIVQYPLLFLVALNLAREHGATRTFNQVLLWFAGTAGLLGLLQIASFQPSMDLGAWITGNDEIASPLPWKVHRATGAFYSWHAYGGYLAAVLLLSAGWMTRKGSKAGWLRWVALSLVSAGLVASMTFAPIVIGIGGALALAARENRWGAIALATSCVGLLSTRLSMGDAISQRLGGGESAVGSVTQTLGFRLAVWERDFLPLIESNLFLGYGPIAEQDKVFAYTESMYVEVLVRGGILLLLGLIVLLVRLWSAARANVAAQGGGSASFDGGVSLATMVMVPVLAFAMLIHPYLLDAGISQLFFIAAGFVSRFALIRESEA